jgi:hypothetical protein
MADKNLTTIKTIDRTRVLLFAEAGGGGPGQPPGERTPEWRRLSFAMEHQQQDNWCWAAVSASIASFYSVPENWTQCAIASAELNMECCEDGGACDRWWYLDRALERTGTLARVETGEPVDLTGVVGEIDSDRPVAVRIGWPGRGGHFIAVGAYGDGGRLVGAEDPWYGVSDLPATTLIHSYQGTGTWTHTYFTQAGV